MAWNDWLSGGLEGAASVARLSGIPAFGAGTRAAMEQYQKMTPLERQWAGPLGTGLLLAEKAFPAFTENLPSRDLVPLLGLFGEGGPTPEQLRRPEAPVGAGSPPTTDYSSLEQFSRDRQIPPGWHPPLAITPPTSVPTATATTPTQNDRPGYSVVERDGKKVYTNLPGVGKELAYVPPEGTVPEAYHLPVPTAEEVRAGAGRMSSLNSGRMGSFQVRPGPGGFTPGAPDPTEATWQEVKSKTTKLNEGLPTEQVIPAYNDIQLAHWVQRNMAGAPIAAIESQLGKEAAEAELARRQAGTFEAQTESLRRQAAQTPLDRVMQQTIILLEQDIARQAETNPIIKGRLDVLEYEELQKLLVMRGVIKPGMPIPEGFKNQVLEDAAKSEAIRRYVMERMTPIQERLAQQGVTP